MRSQKNIHNFSIFIAIILFLAIAYPTSTLIAQDAEDDAVEVFWDDEEDVIDDEEYLEEDEYYEDDDYYDDEYYEDELDDEYADEDSLYYDEDYEEEYVEEELTEEELADLAKTMGYSIMVTGASPGFVNHPLTDYNSSIDYRISIEFPLLMQLGSVRFRFGAEIGSFNFENYLPIGGKYTGASVLGIISFPAGPGKVKFGTGMVGSSFGFIAENSYGFAIRNAVDLRFGIRSTSAINVKDSVENDLGFSSWVDGFITIGFTL